MAQEQKTPTSRIRVKRTRKRLYDPAPEEPKKSPEGASAEITDTQSHAEPSRLAEANRLINRYVIWSAGTALVPIPFMDLIAVTAIELNMLRKLSAHYGITFTEQRGKALIASLIGGLHAGLFSRSLLKMIPVVGISGAVAPIAVLAGALTYAVGKVFLHHFEAGGTLLDFDPSKVKRYFEKHFRQGKNGVK